MSRTEMYDNLMVLTNVVAKYSNVMSFDDVLTIANILVDVAQDIHNIPKKFGVVIDKNTNNIAVLDDSGNIIADTDMANKDVLFSVTINTFDKAIQFDSMDNKAIDDIMMSIVFGDLFNTSKF